MCSRSKVATGLEKLGERGLVNGMCLCVGLRVCVFRWDIPERNSKLGVSPNLRAAAFCFAHSTLSQIGFQSHDQRTAMIPYPVPTELRVHKTPPPRPQPRSHLCLKPHISFSHGMEGKAPLQLSRLSNEPRLLVETMNGLEKTRVWSLKHRSLMATDTDTECENVCELRGGKEASEMVWNKKAF